MLIEQHTKILKPLTRPFIEPVYVPMRPTLNAVLTLEFNDHAVSLLADEGLRAVLGRVHPANRVQPTIDLSPYGGIESGTSRSHAAIFYADDQWWIEDLGSSNGTWLNGERLAPFVPEPIYEGGSLCLANLEIGLTLSDSTQVAV